MAMIQGIFAREILDSRGLPTVECTLWLDTGSVVVTSVPTGTSKGKYEAVELRDNDPNHMQGMGVLQAVNNVNTILAPLLIGQDPLNQTEIDQLLINTDGTPRKSKLGANALMAVSLAVCKAGAASLNLPLYSYLFQKYKPTEAITIPTCIYTLINGGKHGADNLDIQEFQVIPASHLDYPSSLNLGTSLYHKLEEVLITKGAVHSVGLVGGFTPNLYNNTDAFELLVETTKASTYTFAQDLFFGVDMAASNLFQNGTYHLKDKAQPYSSHDLYEYYLSLRNLYHVFYIEDAFHEDDWKSWKKLVEEMGGTTTIVGDSFLATNKERTSKAISEKACNAFVLKPNEVGTLSEAIEVMQMARQAGWQVILSHRSGETNDDALADLAVGLGVDFCKFGPPNRGERITKYNRLLQIYNELPPAPPAPVAQPAAETPPDQSVSPS
jgi:enolase